VSIKTVIQIKKIDFYKLYRFDKEVLTR
jgi:hypothetical protein